MSTHAKPSRVLEEYYYNREAIARYRQAMAQLEFEEQSRPPARPPPGTHKQQYIHSEEEMRSAMPLHKRDTDDVQLQAAAAQHQQPRPGADADTTQPSFSAAGEDARNNALLSNYYTGQDLSAAAAEVTGIIGNSKRPPGLYQSIGPKMKVQLQPQQNNAVDPPLRPAPQAPTSPAGGDAPLLRQYAEMRRSREQSQRQQQLSDQKAQDAATHQVQAWEGFFNYAAPHPAVVATTPSTVRGDANNSGDLREGIDRLRHGRGYAGMKNGREQLSERRHKAGGAMSPDDDPMKPMSPHEKARFAKELADMERSKDLDTTGELADGKGDVGEDAGREQPTLYTEFSRGLGGGASGAQHEGEDGDDDEGGGYAASLYYKGRIFQDAIRRRNMEQKERIESSKMEECSFAPRINPFSRAVHQARQDAYPAVNERDRNNSSAVLRRNSIVAHYNLSVWRERGGDESTEEFVDQHHSFHRKHGLEFSTAEAREQILRLQQEEENLPSDGDNGVADPDAIVNAHNGPSAAPTATEALERYRDRGELGARNIGHYLHNLGKRKEYHHELLRKQREQEIEQECTFRPSTVQSPWVQQVTPRYLMNGNGAKHNASPAAIAGPLCTAVETSGAGPKPYQTDVSNDHSAHHDSHCHYTGAEECTFHPVINSPKRHRATTPQRTTTPANRASSVERRKRLPWLQKAVAVPSSSSNNNNNNADSGSTAEYEEEQEAVFDAYLKTPVHERLHWSRKLTVTHDAFHQHHHNKVDRYEEQHNSRYNAQRLSDDDMRKFQQRMADAAHAKEEKMKQYAAAVAKKELPFNPKLSAASRAYTPKKTLRERNEEMQKRRLERARGPGSADSGIDTAPEFGKEDAMDDTACKPQITALARHMKPHTVEELADGKREDHKRKVDRLRHEQEEREMKDATFAPHVEYNDEYKNKGKIMEAVRTKEAYVKFLEGEQLKKEQLARHYMKERVTVGTDEEAECTFRPEIHPAPNYARAINATLHAAGESCHENAHRRCASQDSARPMWKHN